MKMRGIVFRVGLSSARARRAETRTSRTPKSSVSPVSQGDGPLSAASGPKLASCRVLPLLHGGILDMN